MELWIPKMGTRWSAGFLLMVFALGADCLRDVRMEIHPEQVPVGEPVTIHCFYDLEGAPLYAMKLYKGRREFYRYMPSLKPNSLVFPLLGMEVDLSESDGHRVVLKKANRKLSGNYSCEVSADAPSFSTAVVFRQMLVAILPTQNPMLHTRQSKYEVGDILFANCTGALSRPAANLTFFINELPVPQSATKAHPPRLEMMTTSREDTTELPLESSSLGLELRLQRSHFRPGRINRLYCQQRVLELSVRNSIPFILSYPPSTLPPPPTTTPKEETIAEPVPERVTSPNHSAVSARHRELPVLISLATVLHYIVQFVAIR